jgi:hypothetical protein
MVRAGASSGISAAPVLEQIQNFPENHFVPFLEAREVGVPAGGAPDFDALIQADQDDIRGDLGVGAQGLRDREPSLGVELGKDGLGHDIMHEQAALLIIQLLAGGREFGLPVLGLREPKAAVERFEQDHLLTDALLQGRKRRQEDRRQPEQASGLGVRAEFPGKHSASLRIVSEPDQGLNRWRGGWEVPTRINRG